MCLSVQYETRAVLRVTFYSCDSVLSLFSKLSFVP